MLETVVGAVLVLATLYVGLGLAFALAFTSRGVKAIDPAAQKTGLGFRLLLVPGAIAFWPLLLRRWRKAVAP